MILTTHALVGAAIGENVKNPWIIVVSSIIVHFILDSFRHGEYFDSRHDKINSFIWKASLDVFVFSFIIAIFLVFSDLNSIKIFHIFLGIFFSLLPDFFNVLYWFAKKNKFLIKVKQFHGWAHRYNRFSKYSSERQWGLRNAFNDIWISLLAILILFL